MPDQSGASTETTRDAWLGGRLTLVQPRRGHRVGSDAALLAAAARGWGGRIVDAGAGVGAVGFAMLALRSDSTATLIEIDPSLCGLALDNGAANRLADRCRVAGANLCDPTSRRSAGIADGSFDLVVTNPPFYDAASVRVSPQPDRARAHVAAGGGRGDNPLALWIRACVALLCAGGRFVMIHRPDALPAMLSAVERRLGAVVLLPIHPRDGVCAHRLLMMGVKGSRAPLRVAPPLALHQPGGALTPLADAIHRGDAAISWGLDQ